MSEVRNYNKLVRDNIPDIIQSKGETCEIEILHGKAYKTLLDEKLSEEIAEYRADGSIEELADILEVMKAICDANHWTWEDLESVRHQKFVQRGGFKKQIYLKRVISN